MRATGIVRRIDDLGRVVIPREIRKNMRIKEGDPLEIFTDGNDGVVFRKYNVYNTPMEIVKDLEEHLTENINIENDVDREILNKVKEIKNMLKEAEKND